MSKQQNHIDNLKKLQECQEKNNINTCMKCKLFLDCKTRKEYVSAVYESMNEDINKGGFNF